jgi:Photosynthetic reaction centre cytochrome C subunit
MLSTSRAFLLGVVVVVVAAGCAAVQQQKAQPVRADEGAFHNLQVLPQNVTHDELIATMRAYARSLGVRCDHCHVPNQDDGAERFDYANDSKPEKQTARLMIRMTSHINGQFISQLHEPDASVSCYTCHRGKTLPEMQLPVEAPGAKDSVGGR